MRGSDTSILISKMKYSNFLDCRLSNPRQPRESEPSSLSNIKQKHNQKNDRPSLSPQIVPSVSTKLTSSTRLLSKTYGSNVKAASPKKQSAIESIMKNLKANYPRFTNKNELSRAKSVQALEATFNQPNQQSKTSIEEIQQKIARFSRKSQLKEVHSPPKEMLARQRSPQRLDIATQKCRELCLQLKKKLLKQTVSTTTTEVFQQGLSIDHFSLGKVLGKGKFSKVYLARHKNSGFIVAVKIISKQTIRKQRFCDQLARQIKVQAYFNHVNLVRLYGFFADQNNVYLVLEYCPGGQLYDIFKVKSKLKDQEWAPIMKGICEGLFALHLHDVIHRDLKPENIILALGLPKIGDFGWAVYSPGDRRDTFCGTPLYISPELLMGGGYDKQVDIWALGVMMYEFLTGRIPFRIQSNSSLLHIVNSKIEYPQALSPMSSALLKMILNKDPHVRLAIMDILEHPYLKNCLAGSTSIGNLLKGGK